MSSFSYPCGSTVVEELPPILKDYYRDFRIDLVSDEALKEMLPFCTKKRYNVIIENKTNNRDEYLVGFIVTINEYDSPPVIVRITKVCTC